MKVSQRPHLTITALLSLAIVWVAGCRSSSPPAVTTTPTAAPPPVLTIGGKPTSAAELLQAYTSFQQTHDSAQKTSLPDYVAMFTNQKLQVMAAEDEGLDTTADFRDEMATYRHQLAQTYLTDKAKVEAMAQEAYQRLQQEVSLSQLFIPVGEYAAPADTIAAQTQIQQLRQRLLAGEAFEGLAKQFSKDEQSAPNGGDLGFITAFSIQYPLETAAYTLPVGSISPPIRSRFGYHLLRINARRPTRGVVQVAHILVGLSPNADADAQQQARSRIDAAAERIRRGEPFATVAAAVSDDVTSRLQGGKLPPFETGRQVAAFEEAAFGLTQPGQVSAPVLTRYGWHLIQLLSRKALPSYADMATDLQQRVQQDSRADVIRKATQKRLMQDYPVQPAADVVKEVLALADEQVFTGKWRPNLSSALTQKTVLTIGGRAITAGQFLTYAVEHQLPPRNPSLPAPEPTVQNGSASVWLDRMLTRFMYDELVARAEADLDQKSPEFRALMAEMRENVLQTRMMEKHVWERAMTDSTGQRAYFEQHRADFQYPTRYQGLILTAATPQQLQDIRQQLSAKPPYTLHQMGLPLLFDHNQTQLSPGMSSSLNEIAATLKNHPNYLVTISGSHDKSEADSVSARRIRNVVAWLQKQGISLDRMMEKDFQGARPGDAQRTANAQRQITFGYQTSAKQDVVSAFNRRIGTTNPAPVTLQEGWFDEATTPLLKQTSNLNANTQQTLTSGNGVSLVQIGQIDPARLKTFDEARGSVINAYQRYLEKQWLAQLRQHYPVRVNETQLKSVSD